jgi:hypothetical protein
MPLPFFEKCWPAWFSRMAPTRDEPQCPLSRNGVSQAERIAPPYKINQSCDRDTHKEQDQ